MAIKEAGHSAAYVGKQVVGLIIGFGLMLGLMRSTPRLWYQATRLFAVAVILLLLATLLFGQTANGSERWISILGIQFQPSELAKPALVLLLAQALSASPLHWRRLLMNAGLAGAMVLLILLQPNLSVTLILLGTGAALLLLAGLPWAWLCLLPPALLALLYYIQHNEYQHRRIVGWLNPWADPRDTGFNLIQSYLAIANGGLWGVGYGASLAKRGYLPFHHTDFIFAVLCEETGIGGLFVLLLFAVLGWRGFGIAWRSRNRFCQLVAFGLTFVLIIQALINIGVTVGALPVTGVTLPLISYGGTSAVVTLGMVGMLLRLSQLAPQKPSA
jgi:cell division protein FtsW